MRRFFVSQTCLHHFVNTSVGKKESNMLMLDSKDQMKSFWLYLLWFEDVLVIYVICPLWFTHIGFYLEIGKYRREETNKYILYSWKLVSTFQYLLFTGSDKYSLTQKLLTVKLEKFVEFSKQKFHPLFYLTSETFLVILRSKISGKEYIINLKINFLMSTAVYFACRIPLFWCWIMLYSVWSLHVSFPN